jgi:HSP20 family protein
MVDELEAVGVRLSGDALAGLLVQSEMNMTYATAMTRSTPVFGLRREIDRLFEDTFGRGQFGTNAWTPAVDIRENDKELMFNVDLPGIKPENIDVSAVDGVLTIQGERLDDQTDDGEGRYYLVERNYGSFMRRFQLPQGVDSEKILADVEHGMLHVHIPKASLPKPKKITVTAAADVNGHTQDATGNGRSRSEPVKLTAGARQSK